jgi:hypothetical protein
MLHRDIQTYSLCLHSWMLHRDINTDLGSVSAQLDAVQRHKYGFRIRVCTARNCTELLSAPEEL